ncbi:hypothetical protein ACH41H_48200 [Streptomyces sp. NPDC020800]|uniref:hypothetical protein n=1 Tax=Streptomyces sp. NPDC020800 TaxID=3365092 RepID=UPI00378941F3
MSTIRAVLRTAADDVSRTCDPADIATARDVIGSHLRRRRSLPTQPPVEFQAQLSLDLLPDDKAAVDTLLSAQRQQAANDALRRQKADAVAAELADPAAVLVRWATRDGADWSKLSTAVDEATGIANVFARHRPEREQAIEHEMLEVLREFLSSFPDASQKLMLYAVLAAGMDGAQRPHHAAKARALLERHSPPTTTDAT